MVKQVINGVCALTLLVVASCATLSREECQTADWRQIGIIDGSKGREYHYIANHNKSCSEYGIKPDFEKYNQGRAEGLKLFCTREKGYKEGENNGSNGSACPSDLKDRFQEGYQVGIQVFAFKEKIRKIDYDLDKYRDQKKETTDPEKLDLLNTLINKLDRERDELDDIILEIKSKNGF